MWLNALPAVVNKRRVLRLSLSLNLVVWLIFILKFDFINYLAKNQFIAQINFLLVVWRLFLSHLVLIILCARLESTVTVNCPPLVMDPYHTSSITRPYPLQYLICKSSTVTFSVMGKSTTTKLKQQIMVESSQIHNLMQSLFFWLLLALALYIPWQIFVYDSKKSIHPYYGKEIHEQASK